MVVLFEKENGEIDFYRQPMDCKLDVNNFWADEDLHKSLHAKKFWKS